MISADQIRAARAIKGISQEDLAEKTSKTTKTIRRAETGKDTVAASTIEEIRKALESAGVEFIEENGGGPGVRLKK